MGWLRTDVSLPKVLEWWVGSRAVTTAIAAAAAADIAADTDTAATLAKAERGVSSRGHTDSAKEDLRLVTCETPETW